MLKLAADESFNNDIVTGARLQLPELDLVRVQDVVGLSGASDERVLAWAAAEGRVLLTHDVRTLRRLAEIRVERSEPMPGVIESKPSIPVGLAIDDILLLAQCSEPHEWRDQVRFLPLR